ncbi:MAG TPA: carboxypeptidase regulatory-like domain-containing protein [Terriglobales bacterium]|nr:carboxypeptidase regulatory-like domain-containing protein [Terriglobales bacterium]
MGARFFCISLVLLFCSYAKGAKAQITWPQSRIAPNTPAGVDWPDSRTQQASSPTSGKILGFVTTPDGQPVPYASISTWGGAEGPLSIIAGEDGRFELQHVHSGHYELSATAGSRQGWAAVDVTDGVSMVTLTIPSPGDSSGDGRTTLSVAQLAVPSNARREFQKAEDSLHRKKLVEAANHIEHALSFWPRYAQALVFRAVLELNQDAPKLAQVDAEKAVEYDPSYGKAFIVLGSSYNRLQRWDDAIRTLNRGIAIAPADWPGYYELSRALLAKRNFADALRQAEKASTLIATNYPPLHLLKGYAYLGLGNEAAASQELEVCLKLDPNGTIAPTVRKTLDQLHACDLRRQDCNQAIGP